MLRRIRQIAIPLFLAMTAVSAAHAQDGPPVPHPKPRIVAQADIAPAPEDLPPVEVTTSGLPADDTAPAPVLAAIQPQERPEARIGDSGLLVPRFVSLKSGEVYLREGPSPQHKVQWVYVRRGLPVEVIAEYDVWRRIRDADGIVGWVHKGMLDGRRSVMITGRDNTPLRESPAADSAVMAYAQPGVIARLKSCNEAYCEVQAQKVDAYVSRDRIWGVYTSEVVE